MYRLAKSGPVPRDPLKIRTSYNYFQHKDKPVWQENGIGLKVARTAEISQDRADIVGAVDR